jgi:predicted dehydrogenase
VAETGGPLPSVAVVGCGYWGKNIVRNFAELGALVAVSDASEAAASALSKQHGVPSRTVVDLLADPSVQAMAFASPAPLHAEHARAALEAGKHVFVEKPLALTVQDASDVVHLAHQKGLTLMVGHLLRYHPAVEALTALADEGGLGRIRHLVSNRLSLGKVRAEEDVLWSFSPHDISMALALIGEMPVEVMATGTAALKADVADVVDVSLTFPGGTTARISASWLHPYKEHKLTVIGEAGQAVFDDTQGLAQKLAIYRHEAGYRDGVPTVSKSGPEFVQLSAGEPLKSECAHFLSCIVNGATPRTDGVEALRVLAVLDAASRSLKSGHKERPLAVD